MIEGLAGIAAALIAGAFLFATAGPAFGSARARRAVRDLLEARNSLGRGDTDRRRRINKLIETEIADLERHGEQREDAALLRILSISGALVVAGAFGAWLPALLPSDWAGDRSRYIGSACLALASVLALLAGGLGTRNSSRLATVAWALLGTAAGAGLLIGAYYIIRWTPYWIELNKVGEAQ